MGLTNPKHGGMSNVSFHRFFLFFRSGPDFRLRINSRHNVGQCFNTYLQDSNDDNGMIPRLRFATTTPDLLAESSRSENSKRQDTVRTFYRVFGCMGGPIAAESAGRNSILPINVPVQNQIASNFKLEYWKQTTLTRGHLIKLIIHAWMRKGRQPGSHERVDYACVGTPTQGRIVGWRVRLENKTAEA